MDTENNGGAAPGTLGAMVVLRVHATTQLHNIPSILRDIAAQVERKGLAWSKANGSGTSWDWDVREQDNISLDRHQPSKEEAE